MTRRATHRWSSGAVLLQCAFACVLQAQTAKPVAVNGAMRVIDGVVVSSASGQPLDAADVTLTDTKTQALVAETSSDAEGRFAFAHLADGRYSLRATHRGYLASAFDAHDEFSSAIVTGEGLVTTGLRFALKPLAVIFGTLTDDYGDPVQEARVALYRSDERSGTGKIVRVNTVISDDQGNYEFPRLSPGNYYIAVTAQPWYATHQQPMLAPPGDESQPKPRSPLDVAYPVTYYADVTDSDSATPIPIKAGDRVPVNFTLHAVPAVIVSMQIANPQPGPRTMPQLRQDVFGTMEPAGTQSIRYTGRQNSGPGTNSATEVVEVLGVAPGHYEMELREPHGEASRYLPVDASSQIQAVDIGAADTLADISGKVTMAGGQGLPAGLSISLAPQQDEGNGGARVEKDGSFELHGVRPGSYELIPRAADTAVAVAQITATGATVQNRLLKVGSAPVSVAATLVESNAVVSGFAKRNDTPASGVMIVLVPSAPGASRELFRRDQSDSDGGFTLKRVIPGDYTVVAIEDGWALDWARAEVIAHYLPGGVKVRVTPQSKTISLPDSVAVQPK